MRIRNVSGEARYLPAVDRLIDIDEVFEVDADLGALLVDQPANWAADEPLDDLHIDDDPVVVVGLDEED